MEEQLNEQELAKAKEEMMQEIANEVGAVYEVDDNGNKTGVWLPVEGFHNMLELVSDATMKMSMLEAIFEGGEELEEDEEDEDEDECCDEDECEEECK